DGLELLWNPSTDQSSGWLQTIARVAIGLLEGYDLGTRRGHTACEALTDRQPGPSDTWPGKNAKMVAPRNQPCHHRHEQRNVSTALEHGRENLRWSIHAVSLLVSAARDREKKDDVSAPRQLFRHSVGRAEIWCKCR